MKTILRIITLSLLISFSPVFAGAQTLTLDSVEACPGDTILVSLDVTGFTGVAALMLIIPYNPAVATVIGLENINPQIASAMYNVVSTPNDEIRIGWFASGATPANIGTGKLLDLKMVYHSSANNLTFDPNSELSDNAYQILPAVFIPGRIQPGETPLITQQPSSAFVCSGAGTSISLVSSNTLSWSWEMKTGGNWIPLSNGGIYSGVNTSSLNISSVTPAMHLNEYRCLLSHFCDLYSNIVTLNVSSPMTSAGADDTICYGGSTTLTANVNGGYPPYTYLWTPGGPGASILVSPTSTQQYQLLITDSVGCTATDAVTVMVSNPQTNAGPNDTICLGASKTIISQTTGGIAPYVYTWQHGGNQPQTIVSPTAGQTYSITVTDLAGCISSDNILIEVSAPGLFAGIDDTLCIGSNTTLNAGVAGGFAPYQFLWSNLATTQQIVVSPPSHTSYSVTVTDKFNCTAIDAVNVLVSNPVTQLGLDDTLCLGGQKALTANTTGGYTPYSYNWSTSQSGLSIVVTPAVTTPYQVTVTDAIGCISTDVLTVFVSNPVLDAGASDTICYGTQTMITSTLTGGYPPVLYNWSNGGTSASITVAPLIDTWYKVTATDHVGCSTFDSLLIVVSHPLVTTGADDTICILTVHPLTATASGGIGTLQYLWSNAATQNNIQVSPLVSTLYSVTVTDAQNCQATDSKMVVVSNPIANAGGDQSDCIGGQVTFSGTVTGGYAPYSYTWNNNPGQQLLVTSLTNATLVFRASDKFGCFDTDTAYFTAWPNPVITPIPNDTACFNTAAPLTAVTTGGTGIISYLWSTNATTASIAPVITQNTQFWVRATDQNSCIGSDTVLVLVSNPAVSLGANDTTCIGDIVPLSAQVSGGFTPFSYAWSTGGTGSLINLTTNSDTCVNITATDKVGCMAKDTVCILVSHIQANAGGDQSDCIGGQVTFNGTATGGYSPYTYTWNNIPGQSYQITATANANMILKATDKFGCIDTDTALLTAWPNPVVTPIPNDTACFNTAAPLTAVATGGTGTIGYLWSTNATTASIAPVITQNTQFWVRATDQNSCKGSDTVLVLVSNPAVSLGANDTTCIGDIVPLSAQVSGGFTPFSYAWSTGGTGSLINLTTNSDTCVNITATDKVGCMAKDTVCILVSHIQANAGGDQSDCIGGQVTFNGTATGGYSPYTYTWNNIPGQSYQITATANANMILKATDKFGCIDTDTALLTAWPNPVVTPIPNDTACFNTAAPLTAVATGGTGTIGYLWSTNATTASIAPVITQNTQFWVRATDQNNCKGSDTVLVLVSNPAVSLGANDTTCIGDIVPLSAQVSGGFTPFSFAWSTGGTGSLINLTTNSDTCVNITATDKVGCVAKDTVCILVSHIQANAGTDQAACIGNPLTYNGTATGGYTPYTYTWNNIPGQSYQITATANANMILKATDKFGCIDTDTALLTAWPNPVVTQIPDDTVCVNNQAIITASASGGTGTLSYLWNTSATTPVITPNMTQTAQFWVKASDINGCYDYDTVIVLVSDPMISLGPDDTLCLGEPEVLTAMILGGYSPFGYAWSNGAITPQLSVTGTIDTCYSLILTDKIGCMAYDTLCLVVDLLAVNAGQDVVQCPNYPLNLAATTTGGFGTISFLWSTGATSASTIAYPFTDSLFLVTVQDDLGCIAKDSMEATMHPLPMPNLGPDDTMCINHTLVLDPGAGFNGYLWSTGHNTQTITLDSTVAGVGTHQYSVTVTNQFSCVNSDTITIIVDPCTGIDDPSNEPEIRIFPNPADRILELTVSGTAFCDIRIHNATGAEVIQREYHFADGNTRQIDVSTLAPGLYYMIIRTETGSYTRKIVIRH